MFSDISALKKFQNLENESNKPEEKSYVSRVPYTYTCCSCISRTILFLLFQTRRRRYFFYFPFLRDGRNNKSQTAWDRIKRKTTFLQMDRTAHEIAVSDFGSDKFVCINIRNQLSRAVGRYVVARARDRFRRQLTVVLM